MIQIEKFPISIKIYTHKEQNEIVYRILKQNPQGLLMGEITLLTGIGVNNTVHKILKRIKNKVYIRDVGSRTKIYYAKIHAKKVIKMEKKWQTPKN